MCGILGLLLHDPALNAAPEICEGLSLLQHRGQDACGIITGGPRGRLYQCKANGMVRDVCTQEAIARLIGGMGIGHGEHTHSTTTSGYFSSWLNWLNESGVYTTERVAFCGVFASFCVCATTHATSLVSCPNRSCDVTVSVRYPTAGSSHHAEAQPFYVNSPYGITFAHVGFIAIPDTVSH